jgi:hypothetical protein
MNRFRMAVTLGLTLLAASAHAQWLKQPTPGMPRTADGKPNLAAATPHAADGHPDLSGLWQLGTEIGYAANITADLAPADVQPWAAGLSRKRLEDFGKDDPEITGCMPGGPRHITRGGLTKIIQTPSVVIFLFEDLSYRQIFLDGRQMPKDPNPTWMGYSIGRWDGDTLVVDTSGFNGWTRLDTIGHPHSDQLHLIQTFRRTDADHIAYTVTVDDPAIYTKPWRNERVLTRQKGELIEYSCEENNKDLREGHIKPWIPPTTKQ